MKINVDQNLQVYEIQNNILVFTGGPLVAEQTDQSFTLVGILHGDGLNCSRLEDPTYYWKNETGRWSKVGAFERWIQTIIFQETEPGEKHESFLITYLYTVS